MMRGATVAMGWMMWRRNRTMAVGAIAYFGSVAIACRLMPLEDAFQSLCVLLFLPTIFAFIWLFGEFTFGKEFDLASRESCFPNRMFTLPVRTRQLVALPMVYGAVCVAGAWIFFSELMLRPRGAELAVYWPPVFVAVLLLWIQTLAWSSFPHAWARVVVAMTWLSFYVVATIVAINRGVSEGVLTVVIAAQAPVAYLLATRGVASARGGSGSVAWRLPSISLPRIAASSKSHSSPQRAQFWFESQTNGKSLPVMTLFIAMFIVGICWIVPDPGQPETVRLCAIGLISFPWLACFTVAPTFARFQKNQKVQPLQVWMATKPMSTGNIVAAKVAAAAKAVLFSYAIVLVAGGLCLLTTNAGERVAGWARSFADERSLAESIVLCGFVMIAIPGVTWLTIVNNLWFGLTGHRWVGFLYTGVMGGLLVIGFITVQLMMASLGSAIDWPTVFTCGVVTLACLKLLIAGCACWFCMRRRLVRPVILAAIATAWLVFVATVAGVFIQQLPRGATEWYTVSGWTVLLVPGMGIALAPIALNGNRHGA